jgi:hypothetical protein
MIRAYREYAAQRPAGAGSEQQQRESALEGVQEILQWRPLETFKAEHLQFLELLIAYWRELEVEAGAPGPDELQ